MLQRSLPERWPDLIGELQAAGFSLRQIGGALGVAHSTVQHWLGGSCPNYEDGKALIQLHQVLCPRIVGQSAALEPGTDTSIAHKLDEADAAGIKQALLLATTAPSDPEVMARSLIAAFAIVDAATKPTRSQLSGERRGEAVAVHQRRGLQ
ncbi:MAG: helix-turn-helix domain-containing protein [Pseudomonadota bacterium]|nr:helix-turn-helix domain-containing protein [Pseudomonadota bacterium]